LVALLLRRPDVNRAGFFCEQRLRAASSGFVPSVLKLYFKLSAIPEPAERTPVARMPEQQIAA
jgi:hypothetical protein